MSLPKITRDGDCLYLTQDISGMGLYEKSKAIVNFCDKETKNFEKEIDRAIIDILERNGIDIPSTQKSVLKLAFELLNSKGKDIHISDIYSIKVDLYNSRVVRDTRLFSIWLEDDRYLQCGIEVKEVII